MNYLIDTHILLWSFLESRKLSDEAKSILLDRNNIIFYSPVNLWEISMKIPRGKPRGIFVGEEIYYTGGVHTQFVFKPSC